MDNVSDAALIGVVVAMGMALVEMTKVMLAKLTKKESGSSGGPILSDKMYTMIRELHKAHDVKDKNGMPLWYAPREWGETQTEVLKAINKSIEITSKNVDINKQMLEILNRKKDDSRVVNI